MIEPASPKILTAFLDGGDIIIAGDGIKLIRVRVRSGLWLAARIIEVIAAGRP